MRYGNHIFNLKSAAMGMMWPCFKFVSCSWASFLKRFTTTLTMLHQIWIFHSLNEHRYVKYCCYTRRINVLLRILMCHFILDEFIFWTKKKKIIWHNLDEKYLKHTNYNNFAYKQLVHIWSVIEFDPNSFPTGKMWHVFPSLWVLIELFGNWCQYSVIMQKAFLEFPFLFTWIFILSESRVKFINYNVFSHCSFLCAREKNLLI